MKKGMWQVRKLRMMLQDRLVVTNEVDEAMELLKSKD
jgi:SpoU rRNA methylase family enzyme